MPTKLDPILANVCSSKPISTTEESDVRDIRNFCAIAGAVGNDDRDEYCERIGNDKGAIGPGGKHEWTRDSQGGGCHYCSADQPHAVTGSGCDGIDCCGIWGNKAKCKRARYNGDLSTCCWKDMKMQFGDTSWIVGGVDMGALGADELGGAQGPGPLSCFSDKNRQLTCDPDYRDITSEKCRLNVIDEWCGGENQTNTDWLKHWEPQEEGDSTSITEHKPCLYALSRYVYGTNPSGLSLMTEIAEHGVSVNLFDIEEGGNLVQGKNLINTVYDNLKRIGLSLGTTLGGTKSIPFENKMLNICRAFPYLCSDILPRICTNVTLDQLQSNPKLQNWCGCWMQKQHYQKYADIYGISEISCTPPCNNGMAIPQINGEIPAACTQSSCIFDDITINVIKSQGGSISLSSICNSCNVGNASGNCTCIISDVNINAVNSQLGSGIDLRQDCRAGTKCYKFDPTTGQNVESTCEDGFVKDSSTQSNNIPGEPISDPEAERKQTNWNLGINIGIAIIVIWLIILFIYLFSTIGHNAISNYKLTAQRDCAQKNPTISLLS